MLRYLKDIWRCRYFWLSLVKMDLRTRYRRSILGIGWSLLHPIAMTIILCVVFNKIFKVEIKDFAPYLMAGLATWSYVLTVSLNGCQSFFMGESYIRQHPAPLAIYPLRTALGGLIHFTLAMIVVLILAWYMRGFPDPWALWTLIPTTFLLFLLGWSLAVMAGMANVHFQDTQHLAEVGFQILFYATPIMYFPEHLRGNQLGWLLDYNPVVSFLQLIRQPILEGTIPPASVYHTACWVVLGAMAVAGVTLIRLQRRLIFYL